MTEYIGQSSASDRIEKAREALAQYDALIPGLRSKISEDLAEALRALITPPGVHESEADIAARLTPVVMTYAQMEGLAERGIAMAGIRYGIRAGIQSAHETWESEDRPTQEQMLRWLGIDCTIHAGNIFIPEQHIDRED
jgi:hypothetical protein